MLMGERGFYRQSRVALRAAILISAYCAAVECILERIQDFPRGVESWGRRMSGESLENVAGNLTELEPN